MRMFPEDNDKIVLHTPYGRGVVLRTRQTISGISMMEIELTDWTKAKVSRGRRRPSMLFSPTKFPPVNPELGDEVITLFGRGKVTDIRDHQTVVVRISSWRLARRSVVTCFLSKDAVRVVRPHSIYEMNVHEKIEHAQELKEEASSRFAAKGYEEALKLYSKAVDAVRYVQHTSGSSNEIRADLLVVMITCCNNAGICSLLLNRLDETYNFGKNASVLLDAIYEKRGKSKILELLYKEGLEESKMFGTWKVKSLLLIARGLAERYETEKADKKLKEAMDVIAIYKKESDPMFQQLVAQEKQVRKLHVGYRQRITAEKKKEKERAVAMFGGSGLGERQRSGKSGRLSDVNEKPTSIETNAGNTVTKASSGKSTATDEATYTAERTDAKPIQPVPPKKTVSFSDGTVPGYGDEEEEPSLLQEHKEALLLLVGGVLGSAVAIHLMKKRS